MRVDDWTVSIRDLLASALTLKLTCRGDLEELDAPQSRNRDPGQVQPQVWLQLQTTPSIAPRKTSVA